MTLPEVPEWMTDEMLRADAAVSEAEHALEAQLERAEQLREEVQESRERRTDEEVERFKALCTSGPFATPEWSDVARRIANGEFTWSDVAEGRMSTDPGVNAASASMVALAKENPSLLDTSSGPQGVDAERSAAHEAPSEPRHPRHDDDDEDFEDWSFVR